jgi:hypothetical protein
MKRTNLWPLFVLVLVTVLVTVSIVTHRSRTDRRADPHAVETAEVYHLLGVAHLEAGEFGQAMGPLHQALPLYEDAEDKLAQALDGNMVYVPAGAFIMGSDTGDVDQGPQRSVYLDAFEIDRYEVTNAQYRRFLQATGGEAPERWPERFEHLVPAVPAGRGIVPGGRGELAGRGRLLRLGWKAVAHRSRVGKGGPGQRWAPLPLGRCLGCAQGQYPRGGRGVHAAGGDDSRRRQPLRRVGHGGQRVGVGRRLVRQGVLWRCAGAQPPGTAAGDGGKDFARRGLGFPPSSGPHPLSQRDALL